MATDEEREKFRQQLLEEKSQRDCPLRKLLKFISGLCTRKPKS